jgi:hypothetical protein
MPVMRTVARQAKMQHFERHFSQFWSFGWGAFDLSPWLGMPPRLVSIRLLLVELQTGGYCIATGTARPAPVDRGLLADAGDLCRRRCSRATSPSRHLRLAWFTPKISPSKQYASLFRLMLNKYGCIGVASTLNLCW